MSIRHLVGTVVSVLGGLTSILYLLEYLGIKLTNLILPTNTVYLIAVMLVLALCTADLLYELGRALGSHNRILKGEIFGEKDNKFLVGGTLGFRAQYRGNLHNGYFTTKIRPPELYRIFDTGREYEWLVDYNTNRRKNTDGKETGRLNGFGSGWLRKYHKSTWGHKIPFRYPPGEYTGTLMVFDDTNHDTPLAKVPLTFTVLDEQLMPLQGWTADGQHIPAPRSMFVKKPRKRSWLGTLK